MTLAAGPTRGPSADPSLSLSPCHGDRSVPRPLLPLIPQDTVVVVVAVVCAGNGKGFIAGEEAVLICSRVVVRATSVGPTCRFGLEPT